VVVWSDLIKSEVRRWLLNGGIGDLDRIITTLKARVFFSGAVSRINLSIIIS